jgi:hypothetical protein
MFEEIFVSRRGMTEKERNMKKLGMWLIAVTLGALPIYAQSPKRHQQDIVHYQVSLEGGEISKVTGVGISFNSPSPAPPNQSGFTNGFGGPCAKSPAPNVWDCSVTIPSNIADGDYRLVEVDVTSGPFNKGYNGDFHVPLISIENTQTFTFPSKVTVKEQP